MENFLKTEGVLADAIYETMTPEECGYYRSCKSDPHNLSKHLAAKDLSTLVMMAKGSRLRSKGTNATDEITYDRIGFPKCWEGNKRFRFLEQKGEYVL
jgi:hypothetical protein